MWSCFQRVPCGHHGPLLPTHDPTDRRGGPCLVALGQNEGEDIEDVKDTRVVWVKN